MKTTDKTEIKEIVNKLLVISGKLRNLHENDAEYSPVRNNLPNAITFIETAIQELKEASGEGILRVM